MAGQLIIAVDGLAFGLLLFAVAAGLTLTLGAADTLQLSHGTLYLAGAYLGWWLGSGNWAGFVASAALGGVVAAAAGGGLALALRPLRGHLHQALATVGVGLILTDVLASVFGAEPQSVDPPPGLTGSVHVFGHDYPIYRLLLIAVGAALALALHLVVARSRAGILVRATAADADMVAVAGVDPRRVQWSVMAAGAGLAVVAGVLGAPVLGPAPGLDHTVLVLSLIIVVIGGHASIRGALLAALVVGQVQTSAAAVWPAAAPFLLFATLAVALLAQTGVRARRIRTT